MTAHGSRCKAQPCAMQQRRVYRGAQACIVFAPFICKHLLVWKPRIAVAEERGDLRAAKPHHRRLGQLQHPGRREVDKVRHLHSRRGISRQSAGQFAAQELLAPSTSVVSADDVMRRASC